VFSENNAEPQFGSIRIVTASV